MRRAYSPALRATYRVQLHARFTLRDALLRVPYLDALGISHLYTSPILAAKSGSMHGYDVTDPTRLNPELGDESALIALADALHARGMGLIVDIVPNHMSAGSENRFWQDVLARGERSPYAKWFDIAWDMHSHRKLVVPFLQDEASAPVEHEHHRVVHWRSGAREINYRRFFDVNDLVALRSEDDAVFHQTHDYLLALVERGLIDGLRIDHVDGLRRPRAYLARLRGETDRRRPGGVPIFVEKILIGDERLRSSWPVDGTTGYERLNDLEDLFVDPAGFARIEERYRSRRRSKDLTFAGTVRADKRAELDRAFAPEVERLCRLLVKILRANGESLNREQVYHGIEEFIAASPVYRTYVEPGEPPHEADLAVLESMQLVDAETVANRIRALMATPAIDPDVAEFVDRMQQLTGPATAKGVEDTAHYAYIPLVSRNEVGGAPDRPLHDVVRRFHETNLWFASNFPRSLVTTSTHDTKRSGDVRARISALSEIDREWARTVARWRRLNRKHQCVVHGRIVPDPNAELLVYQTLVGIWPVTLERMQQYLLKAVREAKLRTSWTDPDEAYEKALMNFAAAIIDAPDDDPFRVDLARLVARVAPIARWNSLSRVLLHLTIPGTPDVYQGDEAWNFSLVDPDNRRPVDHAALADRVDEKAALTRKVLQARREHPDLFAQGSYVPLAAAGPGANHLVAFERRLGSEHAVVIAPRLTAGISDWRGTSVQLDDRRIEIDEVPLFLLI